MEEKRKCLHPPLALRESSIFDSSYVLPTVIDDFLILATLGHDQSS